MRATWHMPLMEQEKIHLGGQLISLDRVIKDPHGHSPSTLVGSAHGRTGALQVTLGTRLRLLI